MKYYIIIDGIPKCEILTYNQEQEYLERFGEFPICGGGTYEEMNKIRLNLITMLPDKVIQLVEGICPHSSED